MDTTARDHRHPKAPQVDDVVRHIMERHHAYAQAMITVLRPQLRRALATAGSGAPLVDASAAFDELSLRLLSHQEREETEVFPAIIDGNPDAAGLVDGAELDHRRLYRLLDLLNDAVGRLPRGEHAAVAAGLLSLSADVRKHLDLEKEQVYSQVRRP